jgi:CRP-like cAMP-binding protein
MSELHFYLKQFFQVHENDLEKVASFFEPETLHKGDFLVKQGHYCDRLSFITSGLMRIYADGPKTEITQWISSPGYFVTELNSFLFQSPSRFHIQCLSDVGLFTIRKKEYEHLQDIIPDWNKLEKAFLAKCFVMLEDRVFAHLSLSAEERYERFFETQKELLHQVPLQYIASMLGMTPETFSRVRKKHLESGS